MSIKTVKLIAVVLLLLALAAILSPGYFSRFMADDYCLNAGAMNRSFGVFVRDNYVNWSGRFGYLSVTYFISKLPANTLGFQTLVVVLLWLLLLTVAIKSWSVSLGRSLGWLSSTILSLTLLITLFLAVPNLFQDLFWRDGLVNYTLPLLFFTLSLVAYAWSISKHSNLFSWVLLCLSAIASASFSESASIAIVTLWTTLLVITLLNRSSNDQLHKKAIAVVMVSSLCGFLIEFLAPGNTIRAGILPDRPDLLTLMTETLRNVAFLYGKFIIHNFHWVLISLIFSLSFGYHSTSKDGLGLRPMTPDHLRKLALVLVIINVLVGAGVCAAVAYLIRAFPDDRIIIVPYFIAMLSVVVFGFAFGDSVKKGGQLESQTTIGWIPKFLAYAIPFIALALAIFSVLQFSRQLPELKEYAARWDRRDAQIREEVSKGNLDLVVPGLESRYELADLQLESDDWINQCTATSYGANTVTGR